MNLLLFAIVSLLITGCQWILTHPEIIPEAEQVGEEIIKEIQIYEHGRTLSPSQPPMKLKGPSGPGAK